MAASQNSKSAYPWREGNTFSLLIDGDEVFPSMLAQICAAENTVFLEMYLVESGALFERFFHALSDAVKRGVGVYLLFDDYGVRKLSIRDRQRLARAGAECVFYNPLHYGRWRRNLFRDHRKLMVIDRRIAFVGGIGITDAFDCEKDPLGCWHDTVVKIVGPNVADWEDIFRYNWKYWSEQDLPASQAANKQEEANGVQAGRVAAGRFFSAGEIQRAFVKRVLNAERRVWMMTAYFVPSLRLRRALRGAARRGVDVRLLLPGPITDHPGVRYAGRRFFYNLLRAGVRIFEYQPRFMHAKMLLCDEWVSVGSSNVDRWNLRWNLEANQEIEDSDFAAETTELFEHDFTLSEECQFSHWTLRPRYLRLLEWFWGLVDQWLDRMGAMLRR